MSLFSYIKLNKKVMAEKYYQVVLTNGKTHSSIYKTIPNAIKNVGVGNIKKIIELRKELVEAKYLEQTGTQNTN